MNIKQTTLPSGLRLVMVPQKEAATATVLILVGTGSDYETKIQNGISHFLEHLCFKGTPTRPTAKIISESFDSIGAQYNAFTDHECTGYYAKGGPEHVPFFIDMLSDIYNNALVEQSELEKEKGVVIEEINMYEDLPHHKVGEQLYEMMYGDSPAGRSILGTKDSVQSFDTDTVTAYRNARYTTANTVVVVSGAFDPNTVKKLVAKAFAQARVGKSVKKIKTTLATTSFSQKVFEKKTDQAHIVVAFPALPVGHKDLTALSLLSVILGGGSSSRLFVRIREELGVAYYVRTDHEVYTDHGVFSVAAGVATQRVQEVVDAIAALLVVLKKEGVTTQELLKAQEYTVGMMRLGLESSDDIANYVGAQLLLKGEIKTPAQRIAEIRAVTVKDIHRVAKTLIRGDRAHFSMVGPHKEGSISTAALAGL